MSTSYRAYVRGLRELHRLSVAGKEDSPESDAIRDATDGPWEALSEVERERVGNLSEDLYSLEEPPLAAQALNPQAQAKLNEAFEARQRGEWDRALDLLRRWRAHIDPALVSYLRGSIWLEAGDPATAALFFEHASNLSPEIEGYQFLYLTALDRSDPSAGQKRATAILKSPDIFSPVVVSLAAEIEFKSAMAASETEAQQAVQRLEPILTNTLARFEQQDPNAINHSIYVATLSLLGAGYEFRGVTQSALEYYSRGLQVEPCNDALLAARGVLLYGTSDRAITDLETAIGYGSPLIWPYVFLAHHHLVNGRFEECRKLCERALNMNGSAALMSEVAEWMAIAQAELGFPAGMVRASFENAIRLDPSNERARRNLAVFEPANKPITVKNWETRTAGAVRTSSLSERTSSLAERSFAMAA
jgi:tetratricopeptide (TPR) repeat protein